ncbi:YeeE/YedE thiosulfate transporter family protein [soil metagenome]
MSTSTATPAEERSTTSSSGLPVYFALGLFFGFLLIKAEVISWFRIQEMFRFQGFHMYGIFATALPVAIVCVQMIKRLEMRTMGGDRVHIPSKSLGTGNRYAAGGVIFGLGWALTGACPGPLFALAGSGVAAIWIVILSAILGTWTYGYFRPHLPH